MFKRILKISKYIHSCVMLEEEGEKILIDPGVFSFVEGQVKAETFTGISAVLITHEHDDHISIKALKPKTAVPIHDGFLKDFFRERLYKNCDTALKESGISFRAL